MWIRYTGYIQTNMAVTWPLVHTSTGTCQPHPPRKRDGDDRFTQLRKLARMPGLETDTVMYLYAYHLSGYPRLVTSALPLSCAHTRGRIDSRAC